MMKEFLGNSYLFGGNAPFIEDLYEKYLANPQSVPEEWREYFDRMQVLPGSSTKDVAHAPVVESFVQRAKKGEFSSQRTLPAEPVAPERLRARPAGFPGKPSWCSWGQAACGSASQSYPRRSSSSASALSPVFTMRPASMTCT